DILDGNILDFRSAAHRRPNKIFQSRFLLGPRIPSIEHLVSKRLMARIFDPGVSGQIAVAVKLELSGPALNRPVRSRQRYLHEYQIFRVADQGHLVLFDPTHHSERYKIRRRAEEPPLFANFYSDTRRAHHKVEISHSSVKE